MRAQYIRQVEKELRLSRKEKREVVRDLEEIFASALEHGETERQVMARLGTPKEFADSIAAQFGVDNAARRKRKETVSCAMALFIAAAAFLLYAAARLGAAPEGAIGQADAMTNVQIEGAFGADARQIILAAGVIAAVAAAVQIVRAAGRGRRER